MQGQALARVRAAAVGVGEGTDAGPEVGGVELRVILVLHGVIDAVAFADQVVVAAQHGGIHLGQLCWRRSQV